MVTSLYCCCLRIFSSLTSGRYRRPSSGLDPECIGEYLSCLNNLWSSLSARSYGCDFLKASRNFLGFAFLYEALTGTIFGGEPCVSGSQSFRKPKYLMGLKMMIFCLLNFQGKARMPDMDDKLLNLLIVLADAVDNDRYDHVSKFPAFPHDGNEAELVSEPGLECRDTFLNLACAAANRYLSEFYESKISRQKDTYKISEFSFPSKSLSGAMPVFRPDISDCSCGRHVLMPRSEFASSSLHDVLLDHLPSPADLQCFSSSPLMVLESFKRVRWHDHVFSQQELELPFDISRHPATHHNPPAQQMMKRMGHDMRSTKSLRLFELENTPQFDSPPHEAKRQLHAAQTIVAQMHEEIYGFAHRDISRVLSGIESVVKFANELTNGSSDIERVKHRCMYRSGGRVWISFEILAASVISSKQVQDLQEMNPVLTSCDVKLLSACTVGILLRYVRYRQAVNCAEMCKGIVNNIKSLLASFDAPHDSAALSDGIRAIQNKTAQLAESVLAQRHYINPDLSFDPRFLLFEFISGFLLRQRQVELVQDFIRAQQEGKSSVHQMIMGEGKTQVITPLLLLMLADGHSLVIAVCPLQLLEQSRSQFRQRFSAVIHKRVLTFAFDRSTAAAESVDSIRAIFNKLEGARRSRSIVCSTSQAIKALFLKRMEYLHQVRDMPRICAAPLDSIPGQLKRSIHKKQTQYIAKLEMADEIGRILALFNKENKGIALLDEVDLLLHPLHSELNFPVGQEYPLPLFSTKPYGQELRFQLPMFLLDAFGDFSCTSLEASQQKEALDILAEIKNAIDFGKSHDFFQSNPHLVLLDQTFYHQNLACLISSWCCLWLSTCEDIKCDLAASDSSESWKKFTIAYLHASSHKLDAAVSSLPLQFSPRSRQLLNLCRDWVRIYLPHVLSKVHRVSFGLLLPADEERWVSEALNSTSGDVELAKRSVVISKSRRLLSVPFEGKDAPSRSAEFAHPDIAIGLTAHSYRLHGLRERDLRDLIQELKNNMMQVDLSLFTIYDYFVQNI